MSDDQGERRRPEPPSAPGRERVFNLPAAVVAAIALCVGVHLVSFELLSSEQYLQLRDKAAFIPTHYSGDYALNAFTVFAPLTYSFLHGGIAHLVVNMVWLAAFGSPLANRLGPWRFALFWAATAVGAVALHWALHPLDDSPVIGASGAVSGMMGAAARFAFRIDRSAGVPAFAGPVLRYRDVFRSRTAVTFLAVWMIVNLVTGLSGAVPGVDGRIAWEAHIGGFLVGFLGIGLLAPRRPPPPPEHDRDDAPPAA